MNDYLVIQLARIGDLVQSKRLVLSLAREGRVHLVVDAGLAAFAKLVYPFAEVHSIRAHAGDRNPAAVLADNAKAFAALRETAFQGVYNLNRSNLSLCLSGMFDPETVHGYRLRNGQPLGSRWTRIAARWTADRKSSPLNLVDFWGYFHPNPISPAEVNPLARPKNAPGKGQRIGIVLSGRESRRSLPAEHLALAMQSLFAARKGPEMLLLGSAGESEAARKVMRRLKPAMLQRVQDLSGKTSLADLCEIIGSLDLVLTPDTGAMHIAAHLGVPVMATFLSSAWAFETGPYGVGHTVWQAMAPQNCAPCLETAPCPHKVACLAPFASSDWLEHLAGRHTGTWPDNLLGLVSRLDELGVTYQAVDGNPVSSRERADKREIIKEYLGMPRFDPYADPPEQSIAESLLHEHDWMLPDYY